jgi:hypothetical protein
MLYRVVRPMKRDGSRFQFYVRRIPVDVRTKLVGRTLHFPLGERAPAMSAMPRRRPPSVLGLDVALYRRCRRGRSRAVAEAAPK